VSKIRKETVEQGHLTYGSETIHYDVIRKSTVLKPSHQTSKRQIVIKVHPDRRVVATVPEQTSKEAIHVAVNKRAKWIWKHMSDFSSLNEHVLPRQYVSGETQFYLGRRYILKVRIEPQASPGVKLIRGKPVVFLKDSENKN